MKAVAFWLLLFPCLFLMIVGELTLAFGERLAAAAGDALTALSPYEMEDS